MFHISKAYYNQITLTSWTFTENTVIMMPTLSSLLAPQAVIMTTLAGTMTKSASWQFSVFSVLHRITFDAVQCPSTNLTNSPNLTDHPPQTHSVMEVADMTPQYILLILHSSIHSYWYFISLDSTYSSGCHNDDVIKWRHFLRYWPFVRGIHRSPVNSPHKGQWRSRSFDDFFDLCLNKRSSK